MSEECISGLMAAIGGFGFVTGMFAGALITISSTTMTYDRELRPREVIVYDINGDGNPDLLVQRQDSSFNQDYIFLNDGHGNYVRLSDSNPRESELKRIQENYREFSGRSE